MTSNRFDLSEFADNPEPRCAVVLLLDCSGSMNERQEGETRIDALNSGLHTFKDALQADPLARKRIEIATVTFGGEVRSTPFVQADAFTPAVLEAQGQTPMNDAVLTAVQLLRDRKTLYREAGVSSYKPWLLLITDGQSTQDLGAAAAAITELETRGSAAFFSVMVGGASTDELRALNPRRDPLKLHGLSYRELFTWLSSSLSSVSRSSPGDTVTLPSHNGWGSP